MDGHESRMGRDVVSVPAGHSLGLTCRKVGIMPTEYLVWLLTVIDDDSSKRIDELLPHTYRDTLARLDAASA